MSDLAGLLADALAVNALERVGYREVVRLQPRQRQDREHPLADEVVAEAITIRTGRREEAAASRLIDRVAQLVTRELAKRFQQRDVEVASDHRGRDQHSLGGLAQALQPAADKSAHALGELEVFFGEAGLHARAAPEHRLGVRNVKV